MPCEYRQQTLRLIPVLCCSNPTFFQVSGGLRFGHRGMMSRFAVSLVILALGIGAACAAPLRLTGHYNAPRLLRQACVAENFKCGMPNGCCEGLVCVDSPWEGEGLSTCQVPPKGCTPDGERARGTADKAYVAYAPCCSGQLPVPDPEKGYGDWCPMAREGDFDSASGDGCDTDGERSKMSKGKGKVIGGMKGAKKGGKKGKKVYDKNNKTKDGKMKGGKRGGGGNERAKNGEAKGEVDGAPVSGKEEGFVDPRGEKVDGGEVRNVVGGEGGAPVETVMAAGEGNGKDGLKNDIANGDLGAMTMPGEPPAVN